MNKITIDRGFKDLLPALDKETYARLEENILKYGCLDALILWNGKLVDGHARYAICQKHNIPFKTIEINYGNREEALACIISAQIARRNLTPIQLSHYRGLHYRADRQMHGRCARSNTKDRLAGKYRVSPRTIARDANIAAAIEAIGEVSPEAKRQVLAGEIKINKNTLCNISMLPKKDIEDIAFKIEYGTYTNNQSKSAFTNS